jgi:hypothetical protein
MMLGTVNGIDTGGRSVLIGSRHIPYDRPPSRRTTGIVKAYQTPAHPARRTAKSRAGALLIIATGARESYFGHDEWAAVTSGRKTIEDATTMRRRILMAFERAEDSDDEAERRRLLTFVIIGGGPTGVEAEWRGARSPSGSGSVTQPPHALRACWVREIDPGTGVSPGLASANSIPFSLTVASSRR